MRVLILVVLLLLSVSTAHAARFGWSEATIMTFTQTNGTEVQYLARSGRAYLWHPGKQEIISGTWSVQPRNAVIPNKLCFTYEGQRACKVFGLHMSAMVQWVYGDTFSLESRETAPFVLGRGPTRLEVLERKAGVASSGEIRTSNDIFYQPGNQKIWGEPPAVELPVISCKTKLAEIQGNSRAQKSAAAHLYFHGQIMGEKCVDVDYGKAFVLLREIGEMDTYRAFLRILDDRASTGNPRAVRALERYDIR